MTTETPEARAARLACTTITATPCGRDARGNPLKPRTYLIDESRTYAWDDDTRSVIFTYQTQPRRTVEDKGYAFTAVVVQTDSITRS